MCRTAMLSMPSRPISTSTRPCCWSGWIGPLPATIDPAIFLRRYGIAAELVGTRGRQGFQVEPRRWKVEQTVGCLQRYRRLRVDDETSDDTSREMTILASVFMTGMRLERML